MNKLFLLTLAVCLGSVLPAFAGSARELKVTLPAFSVNNVDLPAGEYVVTDLRDFGNSSIFLFRSVETGKSVDIMGNRVEDMNNVNRTNVVLSRSGEKFGIKKIDFDGYTYTF